MIDYNDRKLHSAHLDSFIFQKHEGQKILKTSVAIYLTARDDDQQYGPCVTVDVVLHYTGTETISELQETAINSAYAILRKSSSFDLSAIKEKVEQEESIISFDE